VKAPDWKLAPAALVVSALVALLLPVPGATEEPPAQVARKSCGQIKSTSVFPRAEAIAIRGVDCKWAIRVARSFDHKGRERGRWRCALAHAGGRALFSCGRGGKRGDLRDRPHALIAKGRGKPARPAG
jgi:hypothetical protein